MIKFIATDLDGTLLDEKGELPEEIFPLIEQLNSKGILFSPASGRQYANLKKLFAPVADMVLFICENGALVKYREKTLYRAAIDDSKIKSAIDAVRATTWGIPMLCGEENAYIENLSEPFRTAAHKAYTNCSEVENLEEAIGKEGVCKIAVFDKEHKAETRESFMRENIPELQTVISGRSWCDVMEHGVNKGVVIKTVRERFNFSKDEVIGFGDHMNDYEMLLECGKAYITENGYPPLKKEIGNVIQSNRDKGVIRFLENLI